jgi:hypothetical protein
MHVDASSTHATVTGAIRHAAQLTGTSFQYLLATAQIESSLNPNAKVSTSSARGLFQFIDQTWLATLKQQGGALGYGPYADAITRLPSGRYAVTDRTMVRPIMSLRSDPTASAMMAGAFTRTNAAKLAERLGRDPTEGELYIAHFLGPAGAARLIATAEQRPGAAAAQVFPGAARANSSIFYDRQGHARSASAVYRTLVGRYDVARAAPARAPVTEVAALESLPLAVMPAGSLATETASLQSRPVAAVSTPRVFAAVDPGAAHGEKSWSSNMETIPATRPEPRQAFQSLFSTGGRREPMAPLVTALWSTPLQAAGPRPAAARAPKGGILELFQDQAPNSGALFRGRG